MLHTKQKTNMCTCALRKPTLGPSVHPLLFPTTVLRTLRRGGFCAFEFPFVALLFLKFAPCVYHAAKRSEHRQLILLRYFEKTARLLRHVRPKTFVSIQLTIILVYRLFSNSWSTVKASMLSERVSRSMLCLLIVAACA